MSSSFHFPRVTCNASSNWKQLVSSGVIKASITKKKKKKEGEEEEEKSYGSKSIIKQSTDIDDKSKKTTEDMVKVKSFNGLTQAVAMDCEMVGVGDKGEQSILARVSLVNSFGHPVYDKFVKPTEKVTDYRTAVSGVRPEDLKNGEDFKIVQREVYEIVKGRTLVGHALKNDLKVLFIDHPRSKTRDTSRFFRKRLSGGRPSLKRLTSEILGVSIQSGEHDSIQDARAAMRLYTMYKKEWEKKIVSKRRKPQVKEKKQPANN
ncbi:RNA exonuclease 4 [Brevipalpus obovatus]|uniref:RNA exonuclease 4 n=1 Tax=Brevipalpus obovatus TaxID=246614 RepID=UPI003D9F5B6D